MMPMSNDDVDGDDFDGEDDDGEKVESCPRRDGGWVGWGWRRESRGGKLSVNNPTTHHQLYPAVVNTRAHQLYIYKVNCS